MPPVPVIEVAFASQPLDPAPVWTDLGPWVDYGPYGGPITCTHGRGEPFSSVDVGQLGVTLINDDGRFTPGRAASPYYPNVKTGRRIRYGVMVPGSDKQLVEGDPSFESGTNGAVASGFFGGPTPVIASSALHPADGTKSVVVTWGTGGQGLAQWTIRGLVVGKTYTASFRAFVPTGHPDVSLGIASVTFGSTVATKNALFTLSTTFVATANSHLVQVIGQSPGATAGTQCFLDAMQVEQGSARSTFVAAPGLFVWRFDGYVDRWPNQWDGATGYAASTRLQASDRIKWFGKIAQLRSGGAEDILTSSPIAYYQMNEPADSTRVSDSSPNGQPALRVTQMGPGDGTLEFGGGTGPRWDDQSAPFFRPKGPRDGYTLLGKLRAKTSSTAATMTICVAPNGAPVLTPGGSQPIMQLSSRNGSYLRLFVAGGVFSATLAGAGQAVAVTTPGTGVAMHGGQQMIHVTAEISAANTWRVRVYVDGVLSEASTFPGMPATIPTFDVLEVGGQKAFGDGLFDGVLSHAAVYSTVIIPLGILIQAQSMLDSSDGSPASFWHSKVLQWRGMNGLGVIEGDTSGDDVLGGIRQSGKAPWEVLQTIADTVGGVEYISTTGAPTLQLRTFRYNRATEVTLDIAVDDIAPDLLLPGDDALMANEATAAADNGVSGRYVDTASQSEYGQYRAADIAGVFHDEAGALSAAQHRVAGYSTPKQRVSQLTVRMLTSPPATVAEILSAGEIGHRMSAAGLPAQAPGPLDLFVEGWSDSLGVDEWTWTANVSDASTSDYWIVGDATYGVIGSTNVVAW